MLKSSNMSINFDNSKHMSKKNHDKENKNKHLYNALMLHLLVMLQGVNEQLNVSILVEIALPISP
jgi:hypothetical protein